MPRSMRAGACPTVNDKVYPAMTPESAYKLIDDLVNSEPVLDVVRNKLVS